MPSAYSYVDGAALADLILDVRKDFVARLPYELDETRRPNAVRLVAIEVFEERSVDERVAVVRDLMVSNSGLRIERDTERDMLEYADTAEDCITDLVCEVVCQVLGRDPSIREENERRLALSAESIEDLD